MVSPAEGWMSLVFVCSLESKNLHGKREENLEAPPTDDIHH